MHASAFRLPPPALPLHISLRIAPTIAADYAARGVFPNLVAGEHRLPKRQYAAVFEDACLQHRGPDWYALCSRGVRVAYSSLIDNVSRECGRRSWDLLNADRGMFASAGDLARLETPVRVWLAQVGGRHA